MKEHSRPPRHPVAQEIAANCLGVRARTIGRAISAVYEEAVRPHGVTMPQVNIMALIGNFGAATPGFIAEALAMEKSTVSRNVERMLEKGWIAARRLEDGRRQELSLTAAGEAALAKIHSHWRRANKRVSALLGEQGSTAIREIFDALGRRG